MFINRKQAIQKIGFALKNSGIEAYFEPEYSKLHHFDGCGRSGHGITFNILGSDENISSVLTRYIPLDARNIDHIMKCFDKLYIEKRNVYYKWNIRYSKKHNRVEIYLAKFASR